jgi:hypothetical protein
VDRRIPGCGLFVGFRFGEYGVAGVGELPEVVGENYLVEGAGSVGLGVVDGRSGLLHATRALSTRLPGHRFRVPEPKAAPQRCSARRSRAPEQRRVSCPDFTLKTYYYASYSEPDAAGITCINNDENL